MKTIDLNKITTTALFCFWALVFYAQTNWSVSDLRVTAFRNGDPLMEANSETNWKFCNANQIPAYYKLGESLEDGVLYNYYAIKDERQLAPEGYRIPGIEDIKALDVSQYFQSADGGWKNNSSTGFFNANAVGYISDEAYEVFSAGDAGYYWTNTLGSALKSMAFVFLNGEKGYIMMELKRESFCAVRCVKSVDEEEAFNLNEKALTKEIKKRKEDKLIAQQKAIKEAEEKKLAEQKAKNDAEAKRLAEEKAKKDADQKNNVKINQSILRLESKGQLMVYINSDLGCGKIDVTVNGETQTITNFYSDNEPTCNAKGCATFDLSPGEYEVKASCGDMTWKFTKTVTANTCSKTKLGGKGELMIWLDKDLGCGNIEVTVNGKTETIKSFYTTKEPECNASGCATFKLIPGEYTVTAKCKDYTWSFKRTVKSDECIKTKLTLKE
jgi:uncharacterized protein (TIGR02145 family)